MTVRGVRSGFRFSFAGSGPFAGSDPSNGFRKGALRVAVTQDSLLLGNGAPDHVQRTLTLVPPAHRFRDGAATSLGCPQASCMSRYPVGSYFLRSARVKGKKSFLPKYARVPGTPYATRDDERSAILAWTRTYDPGCPRWSRKPSAVIRSDRHLKWTAPRCHVRRRGMPDRSRGERASLVPGVGIRWLTTTVRGRAQE